MQDFKGGGSSYKIDISFSCVCPVFAYEFHHKIVEVDCRSTKVIAEWICRLLLTMLWQNSLLMAGEKTVLNLFFMSVGLLKMTVCPQGP